MLTFGDISAAQCICIGSGRFLRCVLVPAMAQMGVGCVIAQARSSYVVDMLKERGDGSFEVDVVMGGEGGIRTEVVRGVAGAFALSDKASRAEFMRLPEVMKTIRYIGLGVTEAGIAQGSAAMEDLAELLHCCSEKGHDSICVICTDNVACVGDKILDFIKGSKFAEGLGDARVAFIQYLSMSVFFPNTMVDRITAHRKGDMTVPRTETLPAKALVLEDLTGAEGRGGVGVPVDLESVPGCVVRREKGLLEIDFALKIRIANGIHTAMVYVLALSGKIFTSQFVEVRGVAKYLDDLFEKDIYRGLAGLLPAERSEDGRAVYKEWMQRLALPMEHSTFFVCQNALTKICERLLPTVEANNFKYSPSMAFALAVILRFLTPTDMKSARELPDDVFEGLLDSPPEVAEKSEAGHDYAGGLKYFDDGTYLFKVTGDHAAIPASLRGGLGNLGGGAPDSFARAEAALLQVHPLSRPEFQPLVSAAADLYIRMVGCTRQTAAEVLASIV